MRTKTRNDTPLPENLAGSARPRGRLCATVLLLALALSVGWGAALLVFAAGAADARAVYSQWSLVYGVDHLWGWAALAVFGFLVTRIRRENPRALPPVLAALGQAAVVLGFLLSAATLWVESPPVRGQMHVAAAVCLFLAAGLLVLDLLRFLGGRGLEAGDLFLLAAAQWALIWVGANAVIRYQSRQHGEPSEGQRLLLVHLPILAFAGNLMLGAAAKILPRLLQISVVRVRAWLVSLLAFNLGLILLFGASALRGWGMYVAPAGTVLLLLAVVLYVAGLNLRLRAKAARDDFGTVLFIRLALLWLSFGLLLILGRQMAEIFAETPVLRPPADPYVDAYRHALAAGFFGLLVLTLGQRLISLRLPAALQTPRLARAFCALLTLGVLWRVSFELLTLAGVSWGYRVLGVGGVLELLGVLLFGLAAMRARRVPQEGGKGEGGGEGNDHSTDAERSFFLAP